MTKKVTIFGNTCNAPEIRPLSVSPPQSQRLPVHARRRRRDSDSEKSVWFKVQAYYSKSLLLAGSGFGSFSNEENLTVKTERPRKGVGAWFWESVSRLRPDTHIEYADGRRGRKRAQHLILSKQITHKNQRTSRNWSSTKLFKSVSISPGGISLRCPLINFSTRMRTDSSSDSNFLKGEKTQEPITQLKNGAFASW